MENALREQLWKRTTGGLYRAVLIYTLAGIAIVAFVIAAFATMGASILSGSMDMGAFGLWIGLLAAASLVALVGYILFITGLFGLRQQVRSEDKPAVNLLAVASVFQIVICILSCIPKLRMFVGILGLATWIVMLVGYWKLKDSPTFPALASKGASKVFWSMIVGFIGLVVAMCIMFASFVAGGAIMLVTCTAMLMLTLMGWRNIADSEAPVLPHQQE